jgi:hypothetical protein
MFWAALGASTGYFYRRFVPWANTKSDEHRLIGLGIGRDCGRAPYGAKPRRTDVRRPASEGPGTRPQVAINGIWYNTSGGRF